MDPDRAYKKFVEIFNKYNGTEEFNEADTRSKIIDAILIECLGYINDDISREPHVESGYIDYQIKIFGICKLVIEAKKSGDYFEIPKKYNKRYYKMDSSISTVNNLMKAIKQARNYCIDIGCKYGVVSNGHQIIVFEAITLGKSWKDSHCIVFNSLGDIKKNFNLFWNILSFESVRGGALIQYIDKGKRQLNFKKISSEIHNKDENLVRNDLYMYIQPISNLIFSELLDEEQTEILKECYVFGRSNRPLAKELDNYFTDKLPNFLSKYKVREIIESEKKGGSFQKEYLNKTYNNTKGSLIVLLGGIGSGKSTFLHRFFKIVLSDRKNMIWFYIDFRTSSFTNDETLMEEFILTRIENAWNERYKGNIKSILDSFGFNVDKKDKKNYFSKLFKLLHTSNYSITLIIDNVDQHDKIFQEKLFILSHHLTSELDILTIVALREETFQISTRTGVFDAYYIPKFHIASPNFLSMIIKRIDFTIDMLEKNERALIPSISESERNDLINYFSIIKSSLTAKNKQSTQLVSFIDNISVGNMREALRMFDNFLKSGNTNIKEIFAKQKVSGHYQIAYHQFLKSIILGEHRYYSQERSKIINLFDFDYTITDSHFNLLRILKFLNEGENKRSDIGKGYVEINDLLLVAEQISIRRNVIYDSLTRLCDFSLIELNNQSKSDILSASYVKITYSGKYYLSYLGNIFLYLDLIFIDTPIYDKKVIENLKRTVNFTELKKRLYRTKLFIDYLVNAEEEEFKTHPEYVNCEFTNKYFSIEIKEQFIKLEEEILKSIIK